ncbi:MAG: permease-like cell division protein FtsX [Candidatus Moranbacteria bacterium]|jgi:cell division transport system permease protein|nr:permease-like cell division protein FtsX [Candidatus Moranbacteria bacterium]MDD5652133.1 permease-like cell division protein FtsX [Candidatus Moranbacteria bacterium]MDX9855703.1 permease-like cell division protein FtsX [Candidatus Moranbacteria bacterium]
MKFLKLIRSFKEGWTSFMRNSWLSVATIIVLALSLYVIGSTVFIGMVSRELIENVEKNVSISVYFKPEISEARIKEIEEELKKNPSVSSTEYISRDEALEKFKRDNEGDEIIKEALEEIGENPLFAAISVHSKSQSDYESLASHLESSFSSEINSVNYGKNKEVIGKLDRIISTVEKTGAILGMVFIVIAILITFNTIRISLFTRKDDFEVMRLVGASNLYIKFPPIFEGVLYGLFSSLIAIVFIGITAYAGMSLIGGKEIIAKENILSFYVSNLWIIGGIVILSGLFVGLISSAIAISRYLKA